MRKLLNTDLVQIILGLIYFKIAAPNMELGLQVAILYLCITLHKIERKVLGKE